MFLGKSKIAKLNREHNTKKICWFIWLIRSPFSQLHSSTLLAFLFPPFLFLLSSIKSKNQCKLQRKEQFKLNYFAIAKSLKVSILLADRHAHIFTHNYCKYLFIYIRIADGVGRPQLRKQFCICKTAVCLLLKINRFFRVENLKIFCGLATELSSIIN